ncbi:hypothetical protein D3C80_2169160 [compost metagenome]
MPDATPAGPPTISDKVKADTAKAITENNVAGYLEYLAANNAPPHITDYVNTQAGENK